MFKTQVTEVSLMKQKLMLSSSFRCDQIHKCYRYDYGHTLLRYLDVQQTESNEICGNIFFFTHDTFARASALKPVLTSFYFCVEIRFVTFCFESLFASSFLHQK
jgi:hypothetical protein